MNKPAGRPPVYATPEERTAANRKSRAKSRENYRNITIDTDLIDLLKAAADRLEPELGFRPTMSQSLRYLLKRIDK